MATTEDMTQARMDFDLPLKGERTYLHSTNILSAFIDRFDLSGPVKLEFRRMVYHPIYLATDALDNPDRAGRFSFEEGGAWQSFGIFTDETRAIGSRIPDGEAEIIASARLEAAADRAFTRIGQPGGFIDSIVALNKALVGRHSKGKKAIFSAVALDRIPGEGDIGIDLVKKLGSKIFMSDVLWNDKKIGSLTFMTV